MRNEAGAAARRIARDVARLRTARGETQRELAERLGMTDSMISRLESGTHLPTLATLCRIADGLGQRLEIVFHEHEHAHVDGTRHTHPHRHGDGDHDHAHEDER
ncbi:MAG TPA: helix-turn-helix domain-containing protein [Candidatus Elarobacter sp.]|jgi:transcriptional regulator with XRE-family HTH domain